MLNPKNIPKKTYEELMGEQYSRIPIYSDEWTNFNPSDPGITMLENLTALQIIQQDQMEEASQKVRRKLLAMLGYTPKVGKGSAVFLEPHGVTDTMEIPADQPFKVRQISYETTKARSMTASQLTGVFVKDAGGMENRSFILDREVTFSTPVFGKLPRDGAALYLVFDRPLKPGEEGILYAEVDEQHKRNPFPETGGPVFSRIRWECWTEEGYIPMETKDQTHGFLMSGILTFRQPEQAAARLEDGVLSGYVWRAVLEESSYDIAPALKSLSGFLFPVVQKETMVIAYSYQKASNVRIRCAMREDGYVCVFAKEQKGTSYRRYEECAGEAEEGRFYYRRRLADCDEIVFDRQGFGFAPEHVKNAVKVVIYNEEMMRKHYLGEVYGYDDQEIVLPKQHVAAETFTVIAEREDGQGGHLYDFLKPGRSGERELTYSLYENEGRIVIHDAGDYIGAKLYLGSIAVFLGAEGNVRAGNQFETRGLNPAVSYTNPAPGQGGCFQETLEEVRRRFIADLNFPFAAVTAKDYEILADCVPGLCIRKVHAWMDYAKNEVQVAVMPDLAAKFPMLSRNYFREITAWLNEHRLLASRVCVRQPVYTAVAVSGTIYVKPHYEHCQEIVEDAVRQELDYINGDQGFGDLLRFDRLFHRIEELDCVSYVYELGISPQSGASAVMEGTDIRPAENCLLYPGDFKLTVLPAAEEQN